MNSPRERMRALIERHQHTDRVTVGDHTSQLIQELAAETGADVLQVPSGSECLSWIVPDKWSVREGWVETLAGERIADYAWNPLWLKSYSSSFSGVVSRDELRAHVLSDPERPECLLYDYGAQYRFGPKTEWGFTMPHRLVESLSDAEYRVRIDVEFGAGAMEILDWMLPGELPDTIYIAAHSCHPAIVNDGLACIAVALELFRELATRQNRRWTYRLIVGPEYFAGAAFLARAQGVENLRYGFYLDMLGNGERLGFARSHSGDTYVDAITRGVLQRLAPDHLEAPFRGLWGNDEFFYDGPDFEIPSIALGRDRWPWYHTDRDDLAGCDFAQLEESLQVLREVVNVFEADRVITRNYRGPLYQSRHGLYFDPRENRAGYLALHDIQTLMDGTRSCLEIASALHLDYPFVNRFADALLERGLAESAPRPPKPERKFSPPPFPARKPHDPSITL
ncbi:MAG: aminopeptidase [Chthoniobacter sp.]|nr:aminopeptidase [Chthoniobacter sp.]